MKLDKYAILSSTPVHVTEKLNLANNTKFLFRNYPRMGKELGKKCPTYLG